MIIREAAPGGRYWHWDKMRHESAPAGLTHEQWWLSVKLARNDLSLPLLLRDVHGRPFTLAKPDAAPRAVAANR